MGGSFPSGKYTENHKRSSKFKRFIISKITHLTLFLIYILKFQKSAIYTCNVAQRSMAVRVEVVNRTLVPICPGETAWGVRWPDTSPGLEALLDCPQNFVGRRVSRLCSMKDATTPEWQLPDFSSCLYEPLFAPYNDVSLKPPRYKSFTQVIDI